MLIYSIFKKLIRLFKKALGVLIFLPFYPFIRVLNIYVERIGHLLLETDCLLRDKNLVKKRKYKWIILVNSKNQISNKAFFELIKEEITVIVFPEIFFKFIIIPNFIIIDSNHYAAVMYDNAKCFKIQAEREIYQNKQYKIPIHWQAFHYEFFKKWGIPKNSRYVCLHVREGGYSPLDEYTHFYRNSSIDSYLEVIKLLTEKGIYVIRMGDCTMKPLPRLPYVIDYALSQDKSEILDLTLGANCYFFLGTSSGAALLASIFGKPCCLVNISMPFGFSGVGTYYDLGIPKLFKRKLNNEFVPFREIYQSGASEFRVSADLDNSSYYLVDNSSSEICEIVIEMLERLDGSFPADADSLNLQKKLKSMIPQTSYSYGSKTPCGAAFLDSYRNLLT
jgi:putative glycosyltransferase (TIGR04372 family)